MSPQLPMPDCRKTIRHGFILPILLNLQRAAELIHFYFRAASSKFVKT